jgi:hypothetical protein
MNQLHHRVPFQLVQRQPIGFMPPRDHQAVPRRHRIGIGDAQFLMRSPVAPGRWPQACRTHSPSRATHRLPALQRKQRACSLLRSSEPPWFLGTMWSTSRALWCRVCQATACASAFAAAYGTGEHPDFDRAADRRAVAAPVPEAAGFCVSKQHTSSPRCIRKASRRWRHSCSSSSRSGSATLAFGQVTALLSSTAAQKPSATPPTRP